MDLKRLKGLLKKEEGTKLDFKLRIDLDTDSGKKEFAKDVCAIANSRGGRGYLILGIEDKSKEVVGIQNMNISEEQMQQILSTRCEPPIPVSLDFIDFDGKNIAVISIYDSLQKPFQFRDTGTFYIRRGSTTDTMRKQELVSAFQDSFSLNLELCNVVHASVESIDLNLVKKYFLNKGIEVTEDSKLDLMENASIINLDKDSNEYYPTVGGLLVFSKINSIHIPHNMVRIINKINKDFEEINIISGDLITMIDSSYEIIKKILPINFPIEAVFEGVKNAILYRDYSVYFKEIEVLIDFNSISIVSPGSLLRDYSRKKANEHGYIKRNMWIYEKLITLDDKKRFLKSGRGFGKMKKAFAKHGKVIFVNSFEGNNFKVIYPGINNFK